MVDVAAAGACYGLQRADFERQKGLGNREALHRIVKQGKPAGVLAYHQGKEVGWCAIAPRESYPALGRSRILRPVDDEPVWSVSCFFIARGYRRGGLSVKLQRAACQWARDRGAKIIEGYPVDPQNSQLPDVLAWTGLASAFRKAGFQEVARRSPSRPLMRKMVSN